MSRPKKLYCIEPNVALPRSAAWDERSKKFVARSVVLPAAAFMSWPNGYPCVYAEMYLLDVSSGLTVRACGGSLRTKAASLSHLVRFCWDRGKNFWELYDGDFHDFVDTLLEETHPGRPGFKRRNRNTVRAIIEESVLFLGWLQDNVLTNRTLIGLRRSLPQIRLIERSGSCRGNPGMQRLEYPEAPPPDPRDPKRPMPTALRDHLWKAFLTKSDPDTHSNRYRRRFPDEASYLFTVDFLRSRRELLLLLLEATGARPGEIVLLQLSKNAQCARTNRLVIPTLKRRHAHDPDRKIPISSEVAIKIELHIAKFRNPLLEMLQSCGKHPLPNDRLLLSLKGHPLPVATLTKDFQRIVKVAKVEQPACQSMFRHRFITLMIARHLRDFLSPHPHRNRAMITESDYRSILRKVATFTGHAREESLFHYIDWAWEEIGVFDKTNEEMVDDAAIENINALMSLMAELRLKKSLSAKDIIETAMTKLRELKDSAGHRKPR